MTQQNQSPPPLPPQRPNQVLSYQTPGTPGTGVVCPHCSSPQFKKAGFTWWGGVLGPWMFSHVKCVQCGTGFNSKTGKSNNTAIAIYVGVSVGVVLLIVVLRALA